MTGALPLRDLDHVLAHTEPLWDDLRGERVFVTGGTGFFGQWLLGTFAHANRRLRLGASLVALTRDPDAFRARTRSIVADDAIELRRGDVRSLEPGVERFACVVHAATESSTQPHAGDHLHMFDTVVGGTRRTLEFSAAAGAGRVLLVSTGAVYGHQPPDMAHMREDYTGGPDPLDPGAAYAEGKRAAELLAAVFHTRRDLPVSVARCFAFVGPCLPLNAHFAVGNFIDDVLNGRGVRVRGDGTARRSYLYAADLVIWLWTVLMRGAPGRAYNVGSEAATSIADLAARVAASGEPASLVTIDRAADPDRAPARYVPSTQRARDELGLREWIGLDDAIARTLAWHRVAVGTGS